MKRKLLTLLACGMLMAGACTELLERFQPEPRCGLFLGGIEVETDC